MALTRKMLEAMGIEEKVIEQIIEAHAETVDALKKQRDEAQADAGKVKDLQKKLDDAQAALDAAADDGFKAKFEKEHSDFEEFKAQVEHERSEAEKGNLFRALLREAGVDEKRIDSIVRVTDLDGITVKDGVIDGADKVTEGIKTEWADFIKTSGQHGAHVDNPPAGGGDMTKEAFDALPLSKRMEYANEHPAETASWM